MKEGAINIEFERSLANQGVWSLKLKYVVDICT